MKRSLPSRSIPALVGASEAIREITALVDTVAESDCCVLIEGETGTGKELVARRLHAKSERCAKPFVPVNCPGIAETLFESQFFGHVKGAFTGAQQTMLGLVRSAEGGTLFLDEVGELPQNQQAKLLRVLQDGEVMPVGTATPMAVDTRFVAATNCNLEQQVAEGRFREDLFYRLNVVRIWLPPLRERREDVPVLLDHFLVRYADLHGRPVLEVGDEARQALAQYPWPGNVRELASWVERVYATGLNPDILSRSLRSETCRSPAASRDEVMSLQEAEQQAIRQAMKAAKNNRRQAAHLLQIHRSTLVRKLQEYGVA